MYQGDGYYPFPYRSRNEDSSTMHSFAIIQNNWVQIEGYNIRGLDGDYGSQLLSIMNDMLTGDNNEKPTIIYNKYEKILYTKLAPLSDTVMNSEALDQI